MFPCDLRQATEKQPAARKQFGREEKELSRHVVADVFSPVVTCFTCT